MFLFDKVADAFGVSVGLFLYTNVVVIALVTIAGVVGRYTAYEILLFASSAIVVLSICWGIVLGFR